MTHSNEFSIKKMLQKNRIKNDAQLILLPETFSGGNPAGPTRSLICTSLHIKTIKTKFIIINPVLRICFILIWIQIRFVKYRIRFLIRIRSKMKKFLLFFLDFFHTILITLIVRYLWAYCSCVLKRSDFSKIILYSCDFGRPTTLNW